jgi:hypothetical protein
MSRFPTVFISYSRGSAEDIDLVKVLVDRWRANGMGSDQLP